MRPQSARLRCPVWVCAVERRRFPVGASPTRQPLQPEAIGAVMEVTKWLKPSISVSRIGDSASVRAATRDRFDAAICLLPMCFFSFSTSRNFKSQMRKLFLALLLLYLIAIHIVPYVG